MPKTRNGTKAERGKHHQSDNPEENELQSNKATSRNKRKAAQISKHDSSDDENPRKTPEPSHQKAGSKRVKRRDDDNSSGTYTNTRYSKNPPGGGKPTTGWV